MDLDEWVFYKKKKEGTFTLLQMANDLKIAYGTLSRIANKRTVPTSKSAYLIDKYTHGEVSGWNLITSYYKDKP